MTIPTVREEIKNRLKYILDNNAEIRKQIMSDYILSKFDELNEKILDKEIIIRVLEEQIKTLKER